MGKNSLGTVMQWVYHTVKYCICMFSKGPLVCADRRVAFSIFWPHPTPAVNPKKLTVAAERWWERESWPNPKYVIRNLLGIYYNLPWQFEIADSTCFFVKSCILRKVCFCFGAIQETSKNLWRYTFHPQIPWCSRNNISFCGSWAR